MFLVIMLKFLVSWLISDLSSAAPVEGFKLWLYQIDKFVVGLYNRIFVELVPPGFSTIVALTSHVMMMGGGGEKGSGLRKIRMQIATELVVAVVFNLVMCVPGEVVGGVVSQHSFYVRPPAASASRSFAVDKLLQQQKKSSSSGTDPDQVGGKSSSCLRKCGMEFWH